MRHIGRRLRLTGVSDLATYLEVLRSRPEEVQALLQDLLSSGSTFFLDVEERAQQVSFVVAVECPISEARILLTTEPIAWSTYRMTGTPQRLAPGLTILVVEDDLDTREFVVMLLSTAGYQVLEAASGAAALTIVAHQAVQALLLDLRLPDMDGFAICRHLRANGHAELPILLMTADRTPEVARRAHEAGATTFLAKPFDPDVLLDRIRSLTQPTATS